MLPVAVYGNVGSPVKLGGRLFVDGGVFAKSLHSVKARAGITDVRLTGKVTLPGEWYTKVDVGFAGNKVSLKDAFVQKTLDVHCFRAGYMWGMCSLDQSASSNDCIFMTGANAAEAFYLGRRVGVSYTWSEKKYYASAGAFAGDGIKSNNEGTPGYSGVLRGVYRPVNEGGEVLHFGAAALYRRPDLKEGLPDRRVRYTSDGVTKLSVPAVLDKEVDGVNHTLQWNVEAVYLSRRYFLQGEYLNMNVSRNGVETYRPWGAYVQGGFLIKGDSFKYDQWDALPLTPVREKSLLLSGRFNVTNLNHGEVKGGCQQDMTVGLNYYFTKHLIFKLNASMVWAEDEAGESDSFGVLQTRVQVRF